MKVEHHEDGTTSYTLSDNEKLLIATIVSYLFGRRVGYGRGRSAMAKEISKTGSPKP